MFCSEINQMRFFAKNPIIDLLDGVFQKESLKSCQKKSWSNLYALNEWRVQLNKLDAPSYHLKVWQTELQCPGGGKYTWNQKFQTYESSIFGHPGKPRMPQRGIGLLSPFGAVDFGITFENDGLRAQASIEEKSDTEN